MSETEPEPVGAMTAATLAAAAAGIPHRVVTHGPVRSAAEAAAARGVPESALVKTLVVRVADDDYRFVAVGADRSIAWPKLRALLGVSRLSMAATADLVAITGYARGTVTPFGAARPWPLILDSGLYAHAEISIGGGGHGVAIQLAPETIVDHFGAIVADISVAGD